MNLITTLINIFVGLGLSHLKSVMIVLFGLLFFIFGSIASLYNIINS